MLTVLVRYKNTGNEVLFPATTVEYFPDKFTKQRDGEQFDQDAGLLVIDEGAPPNTPKWRHLPLTGKGDDNVRDVYIMNAAGKTIARYTL